MNRFMGMMPTKEIEIEKRFKVGSNQLIVTLQAGKNGWTILYADGSSNYQDIVDTAENNFNAAMTCLKKSFSNINEI